MIWRAFFLKFAAYTFFCFLFLGLIYLLVRGVVKSELKKILGGEGTKFEVTTGIDDVKVKEVDKKEEKK